MSSEQKSQSSNTKLIADYIKYSWYCGDISYKLHQKQLEIWRKFFELKSQESLFFISRQFGKSFLSCCIAISFAIRNRNSVVRIAAPTKNQAYDIVNDQLSKIILDAPKGLIKQLKSDLRWKVGSSEIRLGTVARAHIDTLRGSNASLIILEEGGFASNDEYKYAYESVIVPQITKTHGKIIHVTTPSNEPEHYIHTDVFQRCKKNNSLYTYTIYDNPYVTNHEINQIAELLGGTSSLAFKREYLCEIVRDNAVVCVPAFNEHMHVGSVSIDPKAKTIVFADFGGSRDKTVVHFSYFCEVTQKIIVFSELVFNNNTTTKTITDAIKDTERKFQITPFKRVFDAPGQLLVDINETHDLHAVAPIKDSWHDSLNWVNVTFESNCILIDKSCVFTIETLKSATFNNQKTDYARTERLGHMDALASLTYGIQAHMIYSNNFRYFDPSRRNEIIDKKLKAIQSMKDIMSNKFSISEENLVHF